MLVVKFDSKQYKSHDKWSVSALVWRSFFEAKHLGENIRVQAFLEDRIRILYFYRLEL